MPIATKTDNPGFLTDAELKRMFCVRLGELESLVETVRENTGGSNQHAVVIGRRGSGKTTLLLRLALEIRSDAELSSRLHPIVFAEESHRIRTCGQFWLECLSTLARQIPRRDGEAGLRRTLEELWKEGDDRLLRERCLGALLDFADQEGKRLVLAVENLDMMFSEMMDPDAGWCLRKTLQTEPRIMMIGSATSRFDEIDRPDLALYDLFRVLHLRPLTRGESVALCENVAGRPLEDGAARRLEILTGGNPRFLAVMARFGAARSFRALMSDLRELVDELTAYFKGQEETLPAEERRVYLALAELWRPATAREVAERARTETSKCSAHLRRLIGRGVVLEAGGTSRRKQYYVSERLYNIYHLLRRSRGTDRLVGALVDFMDAYYSAPEFEELVDRMVEEEATAGPATRLIYRAAFEQMNRTPIAAWRLVRQHPEHVSDDVKEDTEDASALLNRGVEECAGGDFAAGLRTLDNLLHEFRPHDAATVRDVVAKALVNKGNALTRMERHGEALTALEELLERFQSTNSPELRVVLASALVNKAVCLKALGRTREALAVSDELDRRFGEAGSPDEADAVAMGMFNHANILRESGRTDEELDAYDALLRRFGSSESAAVLAHVAAGQVNKAIGLFRLQRWEESIAVCENLLERFGEPASGGLLESMGKAMIVKSAVLSLQGRIPEQLAACDELLSRLDRYEARVSSGEATDHEHATVPSWRLQAHEIRVYARIKDGDVSAAHSDMHAILANLPGLEEVPARTVTCLLASGLALGLDEMASLIRASPSANRLAPLTTAFELEMGLEPRVANETLEVAKDIQGDLRRLRKRLGVG